MSSECELGRTQNNSGSCFRASSLRKLIVCMDFASVSSRARILTAAVRNLILRVKFIDGAGKIVFEGVAWISRC